MSICVHTCRHTGTNAYVDKYTCKHACAPTCIDTCTYACTYAGACTCTCPCVCMCMYILLLVATSDAQFPLQLVLVFTSESIAIFIFYSSQQFMQHVCRKIVRDIYIYIYIYIYTFFRACIFSLVLAEPLYQNVRIDHRLIFDFCYQSDGKSQVESWVLGFSLIFDFSVYLKNSSRITFPTSGGGPLPCKMQVKQVLDIPIHRDLCLLTP